MNFLSLINLIFSKNTYLTSQIIEKTEVVRPEFLLTIILGLGILLVTVFIIDFFQKSQNPWWIEIITYNPHCTYYFGPFSTREEARENVVGFVEDLENEAAVVSQITIKRHQPKSLTIEHD